MQGFGVHTSLWSLDWTRKAAELAIPEAKRYGLAFVEIALLDPPAVDAEHTRKLLDQHELTAVCSLGLPDDSRPTNNPGKALEFLTMALDKTAATGAKALSGVIYGSIGERTGKPPTQAELDAVASVMEKAAAHARKLGLELGLEAVNRYENHMLNTADQTVSLLERIGAPNVFVHLDTYHMNIEEKGVANGILRAREHLKYIHLSESDRGVPGTGTVAWDEVFGALAAIVLLLRARFRGGAALLSPGAWALSSVLFFAYWMPQLLSAIDSVDPGRALREALVDLRYLPFLWLVASAVATRRARRVTLGGLAIIVAVCVHTSANQSAYSDSPAPVRCGKSRAIVNSTSCRSSATSPRAAGTRRPAAPLTLPIL